MQATQFLLTPDGSAARRLRRMLAERAARSGVVVGTWPQLIEQVRSAYSPPRRSGDWEARFGAALDAVPDAFWSESMAVAPQESALAVFEALSLLVGASEPEPSGAVTLGDATRLPDRPRRCVQDIARLLLELDGLLPDALSAIQELLAADAAQAVRHIAVCHAERFPTLTRWQAALVEKLNRDAGTAPDAELQRMLQSLPCEPAPAPKPTSLAALQTGLFLLRDDKTAPDDQTAPDDTVQWLGPRDFLEEAELAAGMAQRMLDADSDLKPADIGVLVPDDFAYALAVGDAFSAAGLALSGLPVDHWQRDLGREALFHFLYCRQKPAPAMALAVCLSSPLMPWSRADGAALAQTVMDGDYRLRQRHSATKNARAMLALLRGGDEKPDTLAAALQSFVALLGGDESLTAHVYQARAAAEGLRASLADASAIDWLALRRASGPKSISSGEAASFSLEGITVWRESHEPWRPVRRLLALGFAAGHYPVGIGASAVFVADDLLAIREHLGLPVATAAERLRERRARFRRQLAAVADGVSFMVPRRGPEGSAQAPSETLVFMHQLLAGRDAAEDLILELDAAADRGKIRFLPTAPPAAPQPPRALVARDIQFAGDLLSLRCDADGNRRPESPSSLETLMVSPLAWLLRRLEAAPLGWAPEGPDAKLFGTLAHRVLEGLFQRGEPLPGAAASALNARAEPLLDDAIRQHGPFLRAAQWQVERKHLLAGIVEAALAWRAALAALGAEILGTEEWLQGHLGDLPIHGQADVLLGLSGGRLLVVDYKRSRANARRPRMQKHYDSQASLYRTMLQTGGPKDQENGALLERLRAASQTGIVYFMLIDQTALSDAQLDEAGKISGWEVIDGDVSSAAIERMQQRLDEIKTGRLRMNRQCDAEFFEKEAGIRPYALEDSPLIELFIVPDDDPDDDAAAA